MSAISAWCSRLMSGGTHLFLYHPVLDTIDNFITDIDGVTIVFVIPKPHQFPGLQLFVPTTFDDPLIVLIPCSFPTGIVGAASVTRTSTRTLGFCESKTRTHSPHSLSETTIRSWKKYTSGPLPPRYTYRRNNGLDVKSGS